MPTVTKLTGDLAQTSVGASGSQTQVVGLSGWTIDWKRKTAEATTTDDATYESSLGSTASWTAKAKYVYYDGDASQKNQILAAITTPQQPQTWNFFTTPEAGRVAFTGQAYIDGITLDSGVGKIIGLDVSLKGTGPLTTPVELAPITGFIPPNSVAGTPADQQSED